MHHFIKNLRAGRVRTLAMAALVGSVAAGAVACSDSTAPSAAPSPQRNSPAPAPAGSYGLISASLNSQYASGDTTVTVFVVRNTPLAVFDIGNGGKIVFPGGSGIVCDPASSGYGPGTWDSPCTALSGNITVTAKTWVDSVTGKVDTDFQPHLRFVPGRSIGVTLFLPDANRRKR